MSMFMSINSIIEDSTFAFILHHAFDQIYYEMRPCDVHLFAHILVDQYRDSDRS